MKELFPRSFQEQILKEFDRVFLFCFEWVQVPTSCPLNILHSAPLYRLVGKKIHFTTVMFYILVLIS